MVAQRLTELVDEILGPPSLTVLNNAVTETGAQQTGSAGCACSSGVPSGKLRVNGTTVELLALPLIFQQFCDLGTSPETAADELLQTVKLYNLVPPDCEQSYREAIVREYAAFCQEVMP